MKAPKFYRYWFYRQYRFSKKAWDEEPEFTGLVGSAMTMSAQADGVLSLATKLIDCELSKRLFTVENVYWFLAFTGIFFWYSYVTMYKDGKWKEIVDEFKNESARQENLGDYFLIIYLLASMIGIVYLKYRLYDLLNICTD